MENARHPRRRTFRVWKAARSPRAQEPPEGKRPRFRPAVHALDGSGPHDTLGLHSPGSPNEPAPAPPIGS